MPCAMLAMHWACACGLTLSLQVCYYLGKLECDCAAACTLVSVQNKALSLHKERVGLDITAEKALVCPHLGINQAQLRSFYLSCTHI